ncbi:LAMI_0H04214g1_1 [Lachancea mirantina]|uniref:LAMI_0H04214g1_1 n=1 Tax=Lachancea mirantina TaxID=1230905 RepID=A0A1G4KEK1_9SACH|nr:LAMI_0H04214g1_1 [Lachancea mirantina]
MCILLATSAHPNYPLILISNRDEFFERATSSTHWHGDDDHILSPVDMALNSKLVASQGTWCGVNKSGLIAVILNLKTNPNTSSGVDKSPFSRGSIPIELLRRKTINFDEWDDYEKFAQKFTPLKDTGPFNLFYGDCRSQDYRLIDSLGQTFLPLTPEDRYMVVSNDVYNSTKKWVKIDTAEALLHELVETSQNDDLETLIDKCLVLGSSCVEKQGGGLLSSVKLGSKEQILSENVFIPPILVPGNNDLGASLPCGRFYGTRSQIVIVMDKNRQLTLVERVLHDCDKDASQFCPTNPRKVLEFNFNLNDMA